MAAVAGVLRFDRLSVSQDVHRVCGGMVHRAPDGVAAWGDDGIGLAHGALRVTPESICEQQPVLIDERWALVVDGRVDNRDSLARSLGLDASTLATIGDADLFALAWQRWQEEFWQHLQGDFALAAWDRRERRLCLMRDRIGVRPLFYAHNRHLLAFASEPEALLGLEGVSRVCEADGLAYLLADGFEFDDFGKTLYRDVHRLQPGWQLLLDSDGRLRTHRYWQPRLHPRQAPKDPREHVEEFIELFDAAVRCRLRAATRPGLLLSGGIDSGCVLAAARRQRSIDGGLPLLPISLVETREPMSSEARNIQLLQNLDQGIRIPIETLAAAPAFADLVERSWRLSHPIDNSLSYAQLACFHAHASGCRAVLDGADGDVVTAAPATLAGVWLASGQLVRALREARSASRVNTYLQGTSPWRILWRGLAGRLQPDWLARRRYRQRIRQATESWIDPGYATRLHLPERRYVAAMEARIRRIETTRPETLAWLWWNPGFMRAMEGTDRTYGRFGIEAWHPWCDQRVVEFFLHLPEEFLARDGWTKWIARSAYGPELGHGIAWYSGKSHLGQQLGQQILDASRQQVTDLLASAREQLSGIVDAKALDQLIARWNDDPETCARQEGDSVLQFATLAGWMRCYRLQPA